MTKKILVWLMAFLFVFAQAGTMYAAGDKELTVVEKITMLEKTYYGTAQTGSLVERVSKLEKDIYGIEVSGALLEKVDQVYEHTYANNTADPSVLTQLNVAEWAIIHSVTAGPVKTRIDNLEQTLLGKTSTSPFDSRVKQLMKLAFSDGKIDVNDVTLLKDTLIKIRTLSTLDSSKSRAGDTLSFRAVDDVYVDGALVIPRGARGIGKVTNVKPKGNFGKNAKLEVSFDRIEALDGSQVSTFMGEKAKEENKSLALAAGASVAGMALLGPIGIVGGVFVHGQDIVIPPGTDMFIQVSADTHLFGVRTK